MLCSRKIKCQAISAFLHCKWLKAGWGLGTKLLQRRVDKKKTKKTTFSTQQRVTYLQAMWSAVSPHLLVQERLHKWCSMRYSATSLWPYLYHKQEMCETQIVCRVCISGFMFIMTYNYCPICYRKLFAYKRTSYKLKTNALCNNYKNINVEALGVSGAAA